ncbi:Hypothetical predicted protein [Podarcis lilfordi]|uniref:Uncharacterized protein n=1 Tax=Podarcis lilfordi TaxID=74358 RepID=A0AA35P1J8_9SAUR|nr:Hypothetical predicted protein [Podarcis lilfordi]
MCSSIHIYSQILLLLVPPQIRLPPHTQEAGRWRQGPIPGLACKSRPACVCFHFPVQRLLGKGERWLQNLSGPGLREEAKLGSAVAERNGQLRPQRCGVACCGKPNVTRGRAILKNVSWNGIFLILPQLLL